jgi:antitoxin component of MazEF toxin-antitoxin module
MITVRLVRNGNALQVTVPRALLHELKLIRGDVMLVESRNGAVVLTPVARHAVGPVAGIDPAVEPQPEPVEAGE